MKHFKKFLALVSVLWLVGCSAGDMAPVGMGGAGSDSGTGGVPLGNAAGSASSAGATGIGAGGAMGGSAAGSGGVPATGGAAAGWRVGTAADAKDPATVWKIELTNYSIPADWGGVPAQIKICFFGKELVNVMKNSTVFSCATLPPGERSVALVESLEFSGAEVAAGWLSWAGNDATVDVFGAQGFGGGGIWKTGLPFEGNHSDVCDTGCSSSVGMQFHYRILVKR